MPATHTVLENLVLTELVQLQRDQSVLERLFTRLPEGTVEPSFLSLWADVEKRADRLERMLDQMAFLPANSALASMAGSPYQPLPAA